MAEPIAVRQSPLAHLEPVSGRDLCIAEMPFLTQVNLRVNPEGRAAAEIGLALGVPLPTEPGTYASADADVLWLGPDEWLVVGEADEVGTADELEARLRFAAGTEHVGVTDVSAQRTALLMSGPRGRDLLSHGCALDLHPRSFGPGRCAQTMLARAQVLLVAHEGDEFTVLVRSSFAGYLATWLLDAAAEYLVE
ncbi:sarcosine oxidase subunit gamma [Streptosporangium sp. 'caverna']|uniref:sarcosine oxidase subunit gamma n=1 Tax=Streptosporangium sp. 'caverna' TaxID=2202249 RepID=UPI000D7DC6B6|nr:sarcosine oxidase subunit gamma family protein [Streptosporangium sp. 'caverna']AWS46221.1 sarcosine oxidase subunit gamma [Streptosporangium sp. 'caverna']